MRTITRQTGHAAQRAITTVRTEQPTQGARPLPTDPVLPAARLRLNSPTAHHKGRGLRRQTASPHKRHGAAQCKGFVRQSVDEVTCGPYIMTCVICGARLHELTAHALPPPISPPRSRHAIAYPPLDIHHILPRGPHTRWWLTPATRNRTRDHLISATFYSQMLHQLSYSRPDGLAWVRNRTRPADENHHR